MNPPLDPKATRFDQLSAWLNAAVVLAVVLMGGALLLPDEAASILGGALLAVLVATPLLRVTWFVQRWFRRGDPRYASVGLGVLLVVAIGALLA